MRAALVLLALLALTGCETLGYYRQGVAGQLAFYGAREPIDRVLASGDLSADERRRLELVPQLLDFARDELALPVQGQYRDYVRVDGEAVAWTVFAAPELSLAPRRWCYFFRTLCVEYRGYFAREDAVAYAARLAAQGEDTHVAGVAAFSSLGLLDDPVTSVLTAYPDDLFAAVLFHELAHAVVYVKDDTLFNESFATAVEQEGLRRWLAARGRPDGEATVRAFRAGQAVLVATALDLRERLAAVYTADLPADEKRARKQAILAGAVADYEARCAATPGAACESRAWFGTGLNNARLNAVAAYEAWVPAFAALIAAHDADLAGFYRTVEALGELPAPARAVVMDALLRAAHDVPEDAPR